MKKLKLSEIREALKNRAIDIDVNQDNFDALIMIQDATDEENVEVNTMFGGDDERLSAMLAHRMLKDQEFNKIIVDAGRMYLNAKFPNVRKPEECDA